MSGKIKVKALFFDVFGTLVDWRGGVAREARLVLEPLGHSLEWFSFAEAWREQYQPALEQVRCGRVAYTKLDAVHRGMLQRILPRFGLESLDDAALDRLTHAWHRLDAWPDVPPGLARLRQAFLLAPVSNGNIALMSDLARRNDLRWDAILGADIARDFKPKPQVYLLAAAAFNLQPDECLMCACHSSDLKAAAASGLRTAFVARPQEFPGVSDSEPKIAVDFSCESILDLAAQLSANR
jgi:2-haloacid dehalogenase